MISDIEAFGLARYEFERRLEHISPEQYGLPTPCTEWSVHDVIDHVLAGDVFARRLLDGATLDEAVEGLRGVDLVEPTVLEDFRVGADRVQAGFTVADPAMLVHHAFGDIPVRDFIEFRTEDYTGHAWDLAVATDQDRTLDPGLLASLLPRLEARQATMGSSEHVPDAPTGGGSDHERVIRLMGRSDFG